MNVYATRLRLSFILVVMGSAPFLSPVHSVASPSAPTGLTSSGVVDGSDIQPYVDRYGQKIAVSWPGKITSDSDLKQDAATETDRLKSWTPPEGEFDKYGGYRHAGWRGKVTGFFHTDLHNGIWWLITPDGYRCFYKGLDNAPAMKWETTPITGRENLFANLPTKDGRFAYAWGGDPWGTDPGVETFAFCSSNLIRKYGADWLDVFPKVTAKRATCWGFSGTGKWGDLKLDLPSLPVLNVSGVPIPIGAAHPDPFDPSAMAKLKDVLASQMGADIDNPNVVAWSVGNEGDGIIAPQEMLGILQDSGNVAAKRAMIDYAVDKLYGGDIQKLTSSWSFDTSIPITLADLYASQTIYVPGPDLEKLRLFYADHYYSAIEHTIKTIDPNHLYAGFWIVEGFYQDESDWRLIARHCDVVGFDSYDFDFNEHAVSGLFKLTRKPVLCGEFSFPQSLPERGYSDFGVLSLKDQTASGKAYSRYLTVAAKNPYCIGVCWFQYRDEPVTGRGPGYGPDYVYGENYPFGLIDVADQPKWTLLQYVRQANLASNSVRAKLK